MATDTKLRHVGSKQKRRRDVAGTDAHDEGVGGGAAFRVCDRDTDQAVAHPKVLRQSSDASHPISTRSLRTNICAHAKRIEEGNVVCCAESDCLFGCATGIGLIPASWRDVDKHIEELKDFSDIFRKLHDRLSDAKKWRIVHWRDSQRHQGFVDRHPRRTEGY
eukprot:1660792-Rhodomonas_salina.2